MGKVGLDPSECYRYASTLKKASSRFTEVSDEVVRIGVAAGFSDLASSAREWITEAAQECGLLATLLERRADLARSGQPGAAVSLAKAADKAQRDLEGSLNDKWGDTGFAGDNALQAVVQNFSTFDADGDGKITLGELSDTVKKKPKTEAALAAQYLIDNPTLFTYLCPPEEERNKDGGWTGRMKVGTSFTLSSVQSSLEENVAVRSFLEFYETMPNDDRDGTFSRRDMKLIVAAPSTYDPKLVAAAQYVLDHPEFLAKLDAQQSLRTDGGYFDTDGKFSRDSLFAVAVNQQAFVSNPELAREAVIQHFPNVSHDGKGIDMRYTSDDGLKALARAGISGSNSLREEVEFVAFLPESEKGTRNFMISAYYDVIGRESTRWMNAKLKDPLDVTDPMHTGWQWSMIGADASNSVHGSINGDTKFPFGGMSLNWTERNSMADGNQIIFTDIAVRLSAMMEAFPPGVPVTNKAMENFFKGKYETGRQIFKNGDRQMRDAILFTMAARDATDPAQRRKLNFQASMSIAVHEQASIQVQLKDIFSQSTDRDGYRAWGSSTWAAVNGQSTSEFGNKYKGRLVFGDEKNASSVKVNLVKDLDKQGVDLPDGGPLKNVKLVDVEPSGPSVLVGGKPVMLNGSSFGAKDIYGWETSTAKREAFKIKVEEWEAANKVTPGDPLDNTSAPSWVNYQERMYYIAQLFRLYTFEPDLRILNLELSSDRVGLGKPLSFLPKSTRDRIGSLRRTR